MAFLARLLRSTSVATGTLSLDFSLETPGFAFQAGQASLLTFPPELPLAERSRTFSLCSAPSELPVVSVATRLTPGSSYKQALSEAHPGQIFALGDPTGEFTLPPEKEVQPLIFLAGGIGITPFRSMIRERLLKRDTSPKIFLLTINRTEEETPFLQECRNWGKEGFVQWVPILTQDRNSSESSRQEKIIEGLTGVFEKAGEDSLFYLAGPPAMVDTFHQTLLGQFLVSEARIKTDMFFGYLPH